MGNPLSDVRRDVLHRADINIFYSSSAWIEGAAVDQLDQVAKLKSVSSVAGFPDLHPGKYGPVGCAILADHIHPRCIGNDIGCGMSVFALDIPSRKIRIDRVAEKFRALEEPWQGDIGEALALASLPATRHDPALGSIGGGNHFCELQAVYDVFDLDLANQSALTKNTCLLMVHSGSRSLGTDIFETHQNLSFDQADQNQNVSAYIKWHDHAVKWAALNRLIIAQRAAALMRTSCRLVCDSPHNLIEKVEGGFLHRKGAAKANIPIVPLAGSRDALSYLLKPLKVRGPALNSLAHGSGRKYDRQSMVGRVGTSKSEREKLKRTSFGGRVVCEDKQLLLEEAPTAYKSSQSVVGDLEAFGLAQKIVSLKPLVTFKKAYLDDDGVRLDKQKRLLQRRRDR